MAPRADLLSWKPTEEVRMTRAELQRLPEYSSSLPTGTAHGKRWRRDGNFFERRACAHLHFWDGTPEPGANGESWYLGEYRRDPAEPGQFLIVWKKVVLSD
jgi:hypothetical protein